MDEQVLILIIIVTQTSSIHAGSAKINIITFLSMCTLQHIKYFGNINGSGTYRAL